MSTSPDQTAKAGKADAAAGTAPPPPPPPPRILTIAGSDASGGAGIQADIKTISRLGGYAMSALTAITAQNSLGVQAITPLAGDFVAQQIQSCISDIGIDAIKIGMLHDEGIIAAVAKQLRALEAPIPIVLDPVMIASSGDALIASDSVAAMRAELFPLASLLTPNLAELELLTGTQPRTAEAMGEAAMQLAQETGGYVLAKGGHSEDARVIDVLVSLDARAAAFDHKRIDTPHTHGTGCTLSSAIATLLGHGQEMEHAVRLARRFVLEAIRHAPGFGSGNGPLGHHAVRR